MDESGKVEKLQDNVWFQVLKTYCSSELYQTFLSLQNIEAKYRMLDALKSTVMNRLISQSCEWLKSNPEMLSTEGLHSSLRMTRNHGSSEETLEKAILSEGASITYNNFQEIKQILITWGDMKPKPQALMEHALLGYQVGIQHREARAGYSFYSTDATVTKTGFKVTDMSNLRKLQIKDLQLFEANKGYYIQGTLIGYPRMLVGVTTLLEDDEGNVVQIALYNFISQGPEKQTFAAKMFPEGSEIKIAEPFFKIFRDGNRGIRVDNPSDVFFLNREEQSVEDIRKRGKELIASGEYLMALEVYFNGVKSLADAVIPLLNNRSQAEIKLEQYEDALVDAAAVLFLKEDKKAQQRYHQAFQQLGGRDSEEAVRTVWTSLLKKDLATIGHPGSDVGTKETGNQMYSAGEYQQAKEEYTSALHFPNMCLLLTNTAIVCLKLDMFQSAIAATAACLRITQDEQKKRKAYYCMAKAFIMLREHELYNLISMRFPSYKELEEMLRITKNCENIFQSASRECCTRFNFRATVNDINKFFSERDDMVCDFTQAETMEHVYINGRGRGIKSTRNIKSGELLLVDHPVACSGMDITETKTITSRLNFNTHLLDTGSARINLISKLLNLVRYDGLLARKLSCLQAELVPNGKTLPVVNLNDFAYRSMSYSVLPFLQQSNEVLHNEVSHINETVINNILATNVFQYDAIDKDLFLMGSGLCLRISLLNHDKDFNCRVIPFGKSMVLVAIKDIPKGCELTIRYNVDVSKWGLDNC